MKIIAIGDTHGRQKWRKILADNPDADRVIFIGDYFDTFEKITAHQQIDNFNDIVALKRENPDKFKVLMGNHDFHYLAPNEKYSGFQDMFAFDIGEALEAAVAEMDLAHVEGNYLFSHAGVTNTWLNKFGLEVEDLLDIGNCKKDVSEDILNFSREDKSGYGEHPSQSPIWVRPNSLRGDMVPKYIQVVGHTTVDGVVRTPELILIDAIGKSEYLIIQDGVAGVGKV